MHWNYINHNYKAHDYYDILYEKGYNNKNTLDYNASTNMQQNYFAYDDDIEVRDYQDPWEDYYRQLELQHNEITCNNDWQQTDGNEVDRNYIVPSANIENVTYTNLHAIDNSAIVINSCEIVHNQTDANYSNKMMHNSNIIDITTQHKAVQEHEIEIEEEEEEDEEVEADQEVNNIHMDVGHEYDAKVIQAVANEHNIQTEVYHCPKTTNCTNIETAPAITTRETTPSITIALETTKTTSIVDKTIERDINKCTSSNIVTNHRTLLLREDMKEEKNTKNHSTENVVEESGLAGALAQLRLGEPRSPEQEAYEQSMRRQAWEQGQVDYTGKDSFDNILKRITETLDNKPTKASKDAADASTGSSS